MLDAPVSGGDKGAREGTLTIMVGGPEDAFSTTASRSSRRWARRSSGWERAARASSPSSRTRSSSSGNMMGVCECLVFAKKAGLDQKKVIDSLSAGAASSWSLVNLGPKAVDRDFAPGFKVKLLQKDLKLVLSSGDELDVALPSTSAAAPALQRPRGGRERRGRDPGTDQGLRAAGGAGVTGASRKDDQRNTGVRTAYII